MKCTRFMHAYRDCNQSFCSEIRFCPGCPRPSIALQEMQNSGLNIIHFISAIRKVNANCIVNRKQIDREFLWTKDTGYSDNVSPFLPSMLGCFMLG